MVDFDNFYIIRKLSMWQIQSKYKAAFFSIFQGILEQFNPICYNSVIFRECHFWWKYPTDFQKWYSLMLPVFGFFRDSQLRVYRTCWKEATVSITANFRLWKSLFTMRFSKFEKKKQNFRKNRDSPAQTLADFTNFRHNKNRLKFHPPLYALKSQADSLQ